MTPNELNLAALTAYATQYGSLLLNLAAFRTFAATLPKVELSLDTNIVSCSIAATPGASERASAFGRLVLMSARHALSTRDIVGAEVFRDSILPVLPFANPTFLATAAQEITTQACYRAVADGVSHLPKGPWERVMLEAVTDMLPYLNAASRTIIQDRLL